MTDEEIIEHYGKKDGFDEVRLIQAKRVSPIIDRPVFIVFKSFINLEDRGLVKLVSQPIAKQ